MRITNIVSSTENHCAVFNSLLILMWINTCMLPIICITVIYVGHKEQKPTVYILWNLNHYVISN